MALALTLRCRFCRGVIWCGFNLIVFLPSVPGHIQAAYCLLVVA
jgi:hypothetical protein